MKKRTILPILTTLTALGLVAGCKPRADGFAKIQHPAISNNVEANEIEWADGAPFGLTKDVFRNVASMTEMDQDQICFEVIMSGFDDDSAAELARAGFVMYVDGERYTPKVEQLVQPHSSTHRGKKTEWETVDTGRSEAVCVDGTKNSQGQIVQCTKWQENAITETRSYDVPMDYKVVQGAGQACFETKGKVKPAEVEHVLLEITNAKSERTSAFWGVQYKATTRLRWDLIGDVPETVPKDWGGFGGTKVAKSAQAKADEDKPEAEDADAAASEEKEDESASEEIPTVGIKACDDYVQAMVTCADKMPGAGKKAMKDGAKQTAESFKTMAENKQTKKSAEQACKQAAEAFKKNPACSK
ncbi:MAG: hypothetical protein HOV80_34100 [Polyangiaceae bacterium]|nr:hypothetical protein [Polyangiaceae bacterium]